MTNKYKYSIMSDECKSNANEMKMFWLVSLYFGGAFGGALYLGHLKMTVTLNKHT